MQASEWTQGNFAERLRQARWRDGLSQTELAKRLQTTQSNLSRAERGVVPREALRQRLAAYVESASLQARSREEVLTRVADSPELRSLITRIMHELNA
ncbi:helix-turn-helix domain-containing protein [Parvularcula oceani]|uniref:helix-turn-helix domain-containing protein n=1 Tax=Parvularcula oceani TaxID=1247963 RepID=UPI0004E2209D